MQENVENIDVLPKRQPNGHFIKGQPSINPRGRPAAGMQSFKDRLAYWLDTKTITEIEQIVDNPKKWGKLLAVDALVARRIVEAAKASGGNDLSIILDRLLGKPAITADLQVTHALASRLDAAEAALLGSPSNPLSLTSEIITDDKNQ